MTAMPKRPHSVLLYCVFALAVVAFGISSTLELARDGEISPFAYGLTFLVLLFSVIGFWFLRWWGVGVGVLAAGYVAFVSPFHIFALSQVSMIAFAAPMIVISTLHRNQFR